MSPGTAVADCKIGAVWFRGIGGGRKPKGTPDAFAVKQGIFGEAFADQFGPAAQGFRLPDAGGGLKGRGGRLDAVKGFACSNPFDHKITFRILPFTSKRT